MRLLLTFKTILFCLLWIGASNASGQMTCSFSYATDSLNNVYFNGQANGGIMPYSYYWDFGNGDSALTQNATTQYNSAGIYSVSMTATDTNGQSCTSTDTVFVNFCQAFFFARSTPFNNTVSFTNYSAAPRNHVQYTWDFGDGSPLLSAKHASHTYQSSGTFLVTLSLFDSLNFCSSTYSDSVVVLMPCVAGFNYSLSPNDPAMVTFTNTASNFNDIRYTFGDGAISNLPNPTHTYLQSGSYIVTQRVRNTNTNCIDIHSDTIQIIKPSSCQSGFTFTINQTTLTINSTATNANSVRYDFGDGNSSYQANPTHTYAQAGNYTICQYVYGSNNCVDSSCVNVSVTKACIANFAYRTSEDTIFLTDLSQNADTVRYDFGDGHSIYAENPKHVYQNSGQYIVCQHITNANGCAETMCDTISISIPVCKAGFSWTQIGDSISFSNLGSNYESLQYDFGDGSYTSDPNPFHIYPRSGSYIVTQTVLDVNRSCVDIFSDTISVTVSNSCVASFQIAIDTNLMGTLFIVNTSSNDASHQYHWTFGDGHSDSVRLPNHSYSENKPHQICLTVYDSILQCTSTFCDTVGLDSNGNLLKNKGYQLRVLEGDFIGVEEKVVIQASIYPNPFSNVINIDGVNLNHETDFILRDLQGRIIRHEPLQQRSIEMTSIINGIYFLEIRQNGANIIQKIVKQ